MRIAVIALALLGAACGGEAVQARVSTTSTVTVGAETIVAFDGPLLVTVEGAPLARDVVVTIEAVVTASTAEYAAEVAKAVTVTTERAARVVAVHVSPIPSDARISGRLHAVVPAPLGVAARAPAGALVRGIAGPIELTTGSGVEVYDAQGTVLISTSGGAILDTRLTGGSQIQVLARGDIDLRLPATPSAALTAETSLLGGITIRHPGLPPAATGVDSYTAQVNGGQAQVQLRSEVGRIAISPR